MAGLVGPAFTSVGDGGGRAGNQMPRPGERPLFVPIVVAAEPEVSAVEEPFPRIAFPWKLRRA